MDTLHTGNLLLDALDAEDRAKLLVDAREVAIGTGQVFYEPHAVLHSVYLPTAGMVSLLSVHPSTNGNADVEMATVGSEGLFVAHAVLGSNRLGEDRYLGQIDGRTIVIDAAFFASKVQSPGRLQTLVFGYLQALFTQAGHGAACNALHRIEQRAARWLLTSHDRVEGDTFILRQEFLANMLGVQRPSVSIAAGALARAGLITYKRGRITVLDREGLLKAACQCYQRIRSEYARLVPLG